MYAPRECTAQRQLGRPFGVTRVGHHTCRAPISQSACHNSPHYYGPHINQGAATLAIATFLEATVSAKSPCRLPEQLWDRRMTMLNSRFKITTTRSFNIEDCDLHRQSVSQYICQAATTLPNAAFPRSHNERNNPRYETIRSYINLYEAI
jgi:hypothetical protein